MADIVSDDFNASALGGAWTLEGPAGSTNLAANADDAYLELTVPEGDHNAWRTNA